MEAGIILIVILVRVVFGGVAAAIASSKGRSTVGWFFGGLFLDVIGIVIVAVLPNLKQQERMRTQAMSERRRLREQLRQEKMKTETFRQHAVGRLDAHDRVLGVDTRESPALAGPAPRPGLHGGTTPRTIPRASTSRSFGVDAAPASAPASPPMGDLSEPPVGSTPPARAPAPAAAPPERQDAGLWYYAADGESRGPVPFGALHGMFQRGDLPSATLVWTEGQSDWLPASEVAALAV